MPDLIGRALSAGVKPTDLAPLITPAETDAVYGYPGASPEPGSDAAPEAAADRDAEAGA